MRALLILFSFISMAQAHAQPFADAYRGMIESDIYYYFQALKNQDLEALNQTQFACTDEYAEVLQKKEMRIHYAFGYFDESDGKLDDGTYSRTIDSIAFNQTSKWLTRACHQSEGHALCGFSKQVIADGFHHYSKNIQLFGENIRVNLYMSHPSASLSHLQNTGALKTRQEQMSANAERNFIEGLKTADIVIYNGHARDGGGPDFKPPVLRKDLHVNYDGHYHVKKEGQKKMLEALKQRPHKNQVLGIFACYTDLHFSKAIQRVNADQRLIVSRSKPDFFTATKTSLGYLDGFLQGHCAKDIGERARKPSFIAQREYVDLNL